MIYTIRISALLLVFLFVANIQHLMAQNLVPNGSFTNIGTDWTFFGTAIGTEAYLAETSYGGSFGTNIVAEVDGEYNLRQTGIQVVPGTSYWFSFRRTRRTAGGAPMPTTINVKLYDGNTFYINQDISSTNSTWDWQCEVFQFTAVGNTVSIDFGNVAASTLGTILDDVTITPVLQPISIIGTACQGGYIELNAPIFAGNPNANYTDYNWTGPNGFTAIGPSIVFNNAQSSLNGNYICTMTLNECLSVEGTYSLTVAPTTININENICSGSAYEFYGQLLFSSGVYDTLISNGDNTCETLVLLQLNVNPIPDVSTNPDGNVDICIGDTLELQLLHPTMLNIHQWIKNGLALNGETGESCKVYISGMYGVVVTSDKGCVDTSATINLTVHELPAAQIDWKIDKAICINDTISFTALGNASYYRWSPEALFRYTTGNENKDAEGILKDVQTEVILTAYNDVGCNYSDTLKITAVACCDLFVPNAFSPNGDGINDYFKPRMTHGQLLVNFKIYDRWGKMVYQNTVSQVAGWDGKYTTGGLAEIGSYNYIIEYTCDGRANEVHIGSVTLVR